MRYILKDYQDAAVGSVLGNLTRAARIFHSLGDSSQFALSATTGAGKTVMAAAAIEALFYGADAYDFEPDPSAVVLWFSDDPNLNEQTRFRLMAASDRLSHSGMVVIEHPFSQPRLEPGKVYFLNTDKLTKTSRLTRGHIDSGDEIPGLGAVTTPDLQGFTIWDTIRNTIEDPNLTLYLVLDEAHRGFGARAASSEDKPTIVRRLINGHAGVPPIPVVWGISATVERFTAAMAAAEVSDRRLALPKVEVDPIQVQESGLLKDTIVLDIPAESGQFDTVLLTRATRKIIDSTLAWAEYTRTQDDGTTSSDPVIPLLVLQLPNTPKEEDVARALATVFEAWPDLPADAVAHVLGQHRTETFGPYVVPYIAPERVQSATHVRVLLAKDAISTGWDCPRAEVLMSFRPARDATHITQLLGRMVRTPLAMRIPGDERLNSVECILPRFDHKTATNVVRILTGTLDDFPGAGGQKVLIDPQEMTANASIDDRVWDALESLPSESIPRVGSKPVKRLTALAQALAADGLRPAAGKDAHAELHRVLDGCAARYRDEVEAAVLEVWTVHGETVTGRAGDSPAYERFAETADDRSIQAAFREAGRALSPAIAGTYVDQLAGPDDPDTDEDGLRDAHVKVAALALVPQIVAEVEREATSLAGRWFEEYRVAIKGLTDERQAVYNDIKSMSAEPQRMTITRPRNTIVETQTRSDDGGTTLLPTATGHLLSDSAGNYPLGRYTSLELEVLDKENGRPEALAWYRNPGRASQDSLGVAWHDGRRWRSLHPDFLFFTEHDDGQVRASIVDPHGHHLSDATPKLRALARFAGEYGHEFHRIEAVTRIDGHTRVLDLKDQHVRAAIGAADEGDAESLYRSSVASNY